VIAVWQYERLALPMPQFRHSAWHQIGSLPTVSPETAVHWVPRKPVLWACLLIIMRSILTPLLDLRCRRFSTNKKRSCISSLPFLGLHPTCFLALANTLAKWNQEIDKHSLVPMEYMPSNIAPITCTSENVLMLRIWLPRGGRGTWTRHAW
jgi:hypothetical protein